MYIGNDQSKAEVDALIEGLAAELNVKDVWINSDLMRIAGLEAENAKLLTDRKELGQISTGLYAEVARLEARLEIDPINQYDGIACRDETIKLLGAENAKLKEAAKAVVETMRGSGGISLDAAEALLKLAALVETE